MTAVFSSNFEQFPANENVQIGDNLHLLTTLSKGNCLVIE